MCFVSRHQIDLIAPIQCHYHQICWGSLQTPESVKINFCVLIPHEFQSRRKTMENRWFLMYLSIPDVYSKSQNWVLLERVVLKVSHEVGTQLSRNPLPVVLRHVVYIHNISFNLTMRKLPMIDDR